MVRVVAIVDSAAIPSAPPICCEVLISPEASPASVGPDPGERGDRDRHEGEPDPEADQEEAGQQVRDIAAVDRDLGEQDQARGERAIPATITGLTPTRVTSWAATADQTIAVPATAR